jgi:hypothetical protein
VQVESDIPDSADYKTKKMPKTMSASAAGVARVAPSAGPAAYAYAPVALRPDEAAAIRDTVDGGAIPNLSYQTVEQMTRRWTTKQLGSGGFGEVFKGMMRYQLALQCNFFLFARSVGVCL